MKPGCFSSEFWLTACCVAYSMWAGGVALLDPSIELERLAAILAGVSAMAAWYTTQRTSLKRDLKQGDQIPT